jgi:hypothetical protein
MECRGNPAAWPSVAGLGLGQGGLVDKWLIPRRGSSLAPDAHFPVHEEGHSRGAVVAGSASDLSKVYCSGPADTQGLFLGSGGGHDTPCAVPPVLHPILHGWSKGRGSLRACVTTNPPTAQHWWGACLSSAPWLLERGC